MGSSCANGKYSRHYWLTFPLLWLFISADYPSSMKYENPTFYVISYWFSGHFNWQIQMGRRGRNNQHSIIYFHWEKIVSWYNSWQENLTKRFLESLSFIKPYGFWCTGGRYTQHYMVYPPLLQLFTSAY